LLATVFWKGLKAQCTDSRTKVENTSPKTVREILKSNDLLEVTLKKTQRTSEDLRYDEDLLDSFQRKRSSWKQVEDSFITKWTLRAIALVLIGAIGGAILGAWGAIKVGDFNRAANIAQFAGAIGTAGLLLATYLYLKSTQRLVEESEIDRKLTIWLEEKRRHENEQRLRRALQAELKSMLFFEHWRSTPDIGTPNIDVLSTTVFESNANQIGDLTEVEIYSIVDFYTRASNVKNLLNYHQKMVSASESNPIGADTSRKDRRKGIERSLDRLS
jgi:hypothetical protein